MHLMNIYPLHVYTSTSRTHYRNTHALKAYTSIIHTHITRHCHYITQSLAVVLSSWICLEFHTKNVTDFFLRSSKTSWITYQHYGFQLCHSRIFREVMSRGRGKEAAATLNHTREAKQHTHTHAATRWTTLRKGRNSHTHFLLRAIVLRDAQLNHANRRWSDQKWMQRDFLSFFFFFTSVRW